MKLQPKTILYVDDDQDDQELFAEILHALNPDVQVVSAENGMEALQLLNDVKNDNSNLPCLIVLDINMPYLDGRQTFERIRQSPEFQKIPVVVFTSSENPNDRALFQGFGIEMITKPDNIAYMNKIATNMLNSCVV